MTKLSSGVEYYVDEDGHITIYRHVLGITEHVHVELTLNDLKEIIDVENRKVK